MKMPKISFVIPTCNSASTLSNLLISIRNQSYDQEKIEIILADGGSNDATRLLARKYRAHLISVKPEEKQSAEYNRAFGAHRARGEILAFFDHDNILPHARLLSNMVKPLIQHSTIVGVETLRYYYSEKYSLLDRYFALFGVNDPLPFYIGKADRMSYMYDKYCLKGESTDLGAYYLVNFDADNIPTLGSNGFLVRRKILMENAKVDLDNFFHIDVNVDLIRKGFSTYAFIKDGVAHLSNHGDFVSYLYRRRLYMSKYHMRDQSRRRYSVFEKKDIIRLIYFIVISLTFVVPFVDSLRGYMKIKDKAWFLHPFMCAGTVLVYGYTFISNLRRSTDL